MTITVYSNSNCSQCEQTKRYLDQKEIPYESKMIQESPEIMPLIKEKGYRTAPVVVTATDSWSGFQLTKLHELATSPRE
jgi:glutaredoxin-like protein NrdH